MQISFSFKEEIQIVRIGGQISPQEDAAIRLKLDEKISRGRKNLLFDLSQFNLQDQMSLDRVLNLLTQCLQSQLNVAVVGIDKERWPKLVLSRDPQPQLFITDVEAKEWFKALPLEQPDDKEKEEKKQPDPEEELKLQAVKELIKKYEIYQTPVDLDPFGLGNLKEIYIKNPNRESIQQLQKAYIKLEEKHQNVSELERKCKEMADKLKQMSLFRKKPLHTNELEAKKQALAKRGETLENEFQSFQQKIDLYNKQSKEFEQVGKEQEAQAKRKIENLEKKRAELEDECRKLTQELQDKKKSKG